MSRRVSIAATVILAAAWAVTPTQSLADWVQPDKDNPGALTPEQKKVEAEVIAFRRELRDAVDRKDVTRLKRYLPENYTATLGNGWVFDRSGLIDYYTKTDRPIGFENLKPDHEVTRVRVYDDDTAVATGTSTYALGGTPVSVRWLVLYVRANGGSDGGWQEAVVQLHRVPDANPGPPGGSAPPPIPSEP